MANYVDDLRKKVNKLIEILSSIFFSFKIASDFVKIPPKSGLIGQYLKDTNYNTINSTNKLNLNKSQNNFVNKLKNKRNTEIINTINH